MRRAAERKANASSGVMSFVLVGLTWQVLRTRLLAMETQDLGKRLDMVLATMGPARSSLAAKCAIRSM